MTTYYPASPHNRPIKREDLMDSLPHDTGDSQMTRQQATELVDGLLQAMMDYERGSGHSEAVLRTTFAALRVKVIDELTTGETT